MSTLLTIGSDCDRSPRGRISGSEKLQYVLQDVYRIYSSTGEGPVPVTVIQPMRFGRCAPPEACEMRPLAIIHLSLASSSTQPSMSIASSPTVHCFKMASPGKILIVGQAVYD